MGGFLFMPMEVMSMCDKQCCSCEFARVGIVSEDEINEVTSRLKATKGEVLIQKKTFNKTLTMFHSSSITDYAQKGVTISKITDYPPEKQAEWAAIKPIDKNANRGLDTLAPQHHTSPFKDVVK
jgi:hypothetical protein